MASFQNIVSIIIPTLNEAEQISSTLEYLSNLEGSYELIVVDGGSTDRTANIVAQYPEVVLILSSEKGRGYQMNVGADRANGDYLFFLHADTYPPRDAIPHILSVLANPVFIGGSFCLKFQNRKWSYRIMEWLSCFNFSFTTFGDQGLFIRKVIFRKTGGFREIPIMEDLEFQHRLRRAGRFTKIKRRVKTSDRRFEKNGVIRQMLVDLLILLGYYLGLSPGFLKRMYPD